MGRGVGSETVGSERIMDSEPTLSQNDPFALLGLDARFDVDEALVEKRWLGLVAGIHPDLAGGDAGAAQSLARLNEARDVVADPLRRAEALLRLMGDGGVGSNDALPEGFLMQMLEVREEAEAAASAGDAQRVAELHAWACKQREEMLGSIGELFGKLEQAPDALAREEVGKRINALRYIERMIAQVGGE